MKRFGVLAAGAMMLFAAGAQAQQAITADGTYLFAGPGEEYPPVVQLGGGYPLQIYGCVGGYTWCDVSYEQFRGWIDGRLLEFPYQEEEVPAYLYGAELGVPIVAFSIGAYWGSHYHDRPFYRDQGYWAGHASPPPQRWDGPPRGWGPDQRERYQHFEEERRTGVRDPNFHDPHFAAHPGGPGGFAAQGPFQHQQEQQRQEFHQQEGAERQQFHQQEQSQRQQFGQQEQAQRQQFNQQEQAQRQQQAQQRQQQMQQQAQQHQQQQQQQMQQRQQQMQQQAQQQAQQHQQQAQQQAQQHQQQAQQQAQQHQQQAQPQQQHHDDHHH